MSSDSENAIMGDEDGDLIMDGDGEGSGRNTPPTPTAPNITAPRLSLSTAELPKEYEDVEANVHANFFDDFPDIADESDLCTK